MTNVDDLNKLPREDLLRIARQQWHEISALRGALAKRNAEPPATAEITRLRKAIKEKHSALKDVRREYHELRAQCGLPRLNEAEA